MFTAADITDIERRLVEDSMFIATVYHVRCDHEVYKECAVVQAWLNYNKTKPTTTKQTKRKHNKAQQNKKQLRIVKHSEAFIKQAIMCGI